MEKTKLKVVDYIFGAIGFLIAVYALWPKGISYNNEGIIVLAVYGFVVLLNFIGLSLINKHWAKVLKAVIAVLSACGALLYIILGIVIYATPVEVGEGQNGTVIVMGAKAIGSEPSAALAERLDAAVEYLGYHPGAQCIVSGGQGEDEEYSEATVMMNYLIDEGIKRSRIIMEDKSRNTKESIELSGNIVRTKSLNENLIICTNGYHQYRCGIYCDNNRFANYALNVPFNIKTDPVYIAREILAIIYDFVI